MEDHIVEEQKRIPVIADYDVVVIGGGIAGVSSAVSAARSGVTVCLIEKTGMLGGLATAGLIAYYLPLCDGYGGQLASGIAEELLHLSIQSGPGTVPECWQKEASKEERAKQRYRVTFNPASLAISLDGWVASEGVDIRFESLFTDVIIKRRCIERIIIEEKSGRYTITSKAVIDASGDALVAHRAGAPTEEGDNWISSWYYLAGPSQGTLELRHLGSFGDTSPGIRKFSGIHSKDITDFYTASRKLIQEDVRKKREENKNNNFFPILIPSIAQFRITQWIKGAFQIDEKHAGHHFEDAIGMIGDWREKGPVYQIPYRSILPQGIENLLAVGRCMSATVSGLEIVRAIPPCAVTGQAAGVAAALAVKSGVSVAGLDVRELQNTLKKQGVILPEI